MRPIKNKYEDIPGEIRNKLSEFLKRHCNRNSSNQIYSFAYPFSKIEPASILNIVNEHFSDFLLYEKNDENFSFIAINKLINLNINDTLTQLGEDVSDYKSRLISNWADVGLNNLPFITGGIKFDSEGNSSEWNKFDRYHFFVPQVLLLNTSNGSYFIFNFLLPDDDKVESVMNEFCYTTNLLSTFESDRNSKNTIIKRNGAVPEEKRSWFDLVTKTSNRLDDNFKKVVLSRRIELQSPEKIDWQNCINTLENNCSECYLFMLKSNDAVFFGASPENFITVHGNQIKLDALAGSAPVNGIGKNVELKSPKNLKEHNYVIDFIRNSLSAYAKEIEVDSVPHIKKLKNVQHLHTRISANLNEKQDIINLIEELFPTPAVCGLPKSDALKTIRETENFDRGLYSGLIGWMDLEMNCEFTVAIRSALNIGKKLFLYAGAGIVDDSNPEEEYNETEMKFDTILNLFDETEKG